MNIVFIAVDQLAAGFLNCYGSGVDSTPVLDRLAGEGTMFSRFYAACPVCAPNRATFLTGRSPGIHGIIINNYTLNTDAPTYAHVLRDHGYRTGAFGKFHQMSMSRPVLDSMDYLGFDEAIVSEDHKWGPWLDWVREKYPEHYETALALTWGSALDVSEKTSQMNRISSVRREEIIKPLIDSTPGRMWTSPLPAEAHDSNFITEKSLDFMQRHIEGGSGKPFFCHVSYVDPHDPYDPPEPYASMFDPEDMPDALPAEWMENEKSVLWGHHRGVHLGIAEMYDKPEWIRKLRSLYHGSVKFLDDQVGRIVEFLNARNIWDDTVLIFTSDHGDMMGDHGLITKGLPHYDKSIRCPLIIAGSGIKKQKIDSLASSLDLYPSFCEFAGVPEKDLPPLEGKSFASAAKGEEGGDIWDEIAVTTKDGITVISDDNWRLTYYAENDEGYMFNLNDDPGEQKNLYYSPEFQDKKLELLQRLVRVSTRPYRIPQYKSLPVINERKHIIHGFGDYMLKEGPPCYKMGQAPYTTPGTSDLREWNSK